MTGVRDRPVGPEFAYVDETGDIGAVANGGSATYTLGCALVPMERWTDSRDCFIDLRRNLKGAYGLKMSQDVKAHHLVGVKSVYRNLGLGDGQVRDIYRRHIDASVQTCSGVAAIVVHKSEIVRSDIEVFETAWEYLLTRLRERSEQRDQPILIVHDDGEADRVRKHLRRFRRTNWQGAGYGSARLLVEDPVSRNSQHSYTIDAPASYNAANSRCSSGVSLRFIRYGRVSAWILPKSLNVTEILSFGTWMLPASRSVRRNS
ncbi:DUF3800 domain-containing protein [Mycolicibacterium madagascariense]|uniref:DUF3800 domain-containing protein n=1 Tax=Mycolicibacterium madagascariense TaxID=212765 RepID=UPI001C6606D5|nr:DUF3800 domain-containing protein [Mycolicibacterium madagascariense]